MTGRYLYIYAQIIGSTGLCLQPLAPNSSLIGRKSFPDYGVHVPQIYCDPIFLLYAMELLPSK